MDLNEQRKRLRCLYQKEGTYKLGDLGFNTKSEMKKYISQWLKLTYPSYVIDTDDEEWVMCLLSQHPSWSKKSKDMKWIEIGYTFGNNHFNIRYQDGSTDDISYLKCLNGESNYQNVIKAFRDSIAYQIISYRNNIFRNGPIKCIVSGINLYNDKNTHIDHNFDSRPFISIVNSFLKEKQLKHEDIKTISIGINRDFEDKQLKLQWQTYHEQQAILRAISKDCNLKHSRYMRDINKP